MKCNAMNKCAAMLILAGISPSGCGGGGGVETSGTAPAIANLQYTPSSTTVNTLTDVAWQFDFTDPDGDVSTGTYTIYDPSGNPVYTKTIDLGIPGGSKTGTMRGTTYNVKFLSAGRYTAKVLVTDGAGSDSVPLTASFDITQ